MTTGRIDYPQLDFAVDTSAVTSATSTTGVLVQPSAPPESRVALCGRCSKDVPTTTNGATYVTLSCAHKMHNRCFIALITALKRHETCDEQFGGPSVCTQCVGNNFGPGSIVPTTRIDRAETLKWFRAAYNTKYRIPYATALLDADLTLEEKRCILGIAASRFTVDRTDYSPFGASSASSEDVTKELLRRNRRIDDILAVTSCKFNAQHLYRFGVRTKEHIKALGYNPFLHGSSAYRDRTPLWMMVELYNVDDTDLFEVYAADTLLATNLIPKELWLCDITVAQLIERGVSKEAFLRYANNVKEPLDLFVYLALEPVHLTRLGIRQGELFPLWTTAAMKSSNPMLAEVLRNLAQE